MPTLQEMYNVVHQRISPRIDVPAEIVLSQIIQESGWDFDSQVNKATNNYSGLTQATPNAYPQPDGGNYYKTYGSVEEWADDYVDSFMALYDGIGGQRTAYDFAAALKSNGYFGADLETYGGNMESIVKTLRGKLDIPFDTNASGFNVSTNRDFDSMLKKQGYGESDIEQQVNLDTQPSTAWERFSGGFSDSVQSSSTAAAGSLMLANTFHSDTPYDTPYKVTEDDIKYVTTSLAGDEEGQRFVLMNGRDGASIRYLTQQKQEEHKRKARLASYGMGWSTAGSLAGGIIDPVNLIPVGAGVNALRVMGRTAGTITNVAKIAKYAKIGAQTALVNTVDEGVRGALSGNKVEAKDYAFAAGTGMLLGIVGGAIGDFASGVLSKQRDTAHIASKADALETDVIRASLDQDTLSSIRSETKSGIGKYHDHAYVEAANNADLTKFTKEQRVFALSMEDAQNFAKSIGKSVDENAKAFHVPNEEYTVLIKDNIKNPSKIDSILKHEIAVHEGLRKTMGDKRFNKLLKQVANDMDTEGTKFYQARQLAGSADPEEVLAYAIEHKMIKDGMWQSIKDGVRKGLKGKGIQTKYTDTDIADFVQASLLNELEKNTQIHFNPDGTTAWAGIKYSKDNLVNPDVLMKFVDLEKDVLEQAQGELVKPLRSLGKTLEASRFFATPVGVGRNSISKTFKTVTSKIFSDPRGREHSGDMTIAADRQKEAVKQRLTAHYGKYVDARQKWILNNIKNGFGRKAHMEFDKQALEAFNAKYAGNVAYAASDFPPEVLEAVEHLKKLRDEQLKIGQNSAGMFGIIGKDNLIEKGWTPVDHELWRLSDMELVGKFTRSFDGEDRMGEAVKFLENYYKAAAKRDVIADKIKRGIEKENAKLTEGSPKKPTKVTDKMIDDYLEEHAHFAARQMLQSDMHRMEGGKLGEPRFLKHRVPIDTTVTMSLPSGRDFSFDNNLRNFDMDYIVGHNINRFAGEVALKNTFGTQKAMDDVIAKVEFELQRAAQDGRIDISQAEREVKVLRDSLAELQGKRPERDTIGKLGALARILQNASYYKNGANMMFAQFGEIGGVMAYAGFKGLFYTFKPLRTLVENATEGKVAADAIRDMEYYLFAEGLERKIWATNWGDRMVRDSLTKDNLINRAIIGTADITKNMGKITSSLNRLASMTDSMTRGVRNGMIGDSIRWAHGENFSKLRNPFSEAKLKAANVSPQLAEQIKADLKKYVKLQEGKPLGHQFEKWETENPNSFWKWRDLIQNQADRAIVSGTQMGNRNILKDSNSFTRMIFQYKDYTFRAINAQTMRAMTAKDFDDFMAMGLSMATNTAAYALKAGAVAATLTAMGAPEKAEKYCKENLDPEMLARVAVLRSSFAAPLSPLNDVYEAYTGSPTIRTTVDRSTKRQPSHDASDVVGDFVTQLPAVKVGLDYTQGLYTSVSHLMDNTANKRDLRNFLNLLPVPNLIPWVQGVNLTVDQSQYPDKRPKGGS